MSNSTTDDHSSQHVFNGYNQLISPYKIYACSTLSDKEKLFLSMLYMFALKKKNNLTCTDKYLAKAYKTPLKSVQRTLRKAREAGLMEQDSLKFIGIETFRISPDEYPEFLTITETALAHEKLSASLKLAFAICDYRKNKDGSIVGTVERHAKILNVTQRSFQRYLEQLCNLSLLRCESRPRNPLYYMNYRRPEVEQYINYDVVEMISNAMNFDDNLDPEQQELSTNSRQNGSNSRQNGSNSRQNGSNSRQNGSTIPLYDLEQDREHNGGQTHTVFLNESEYFEQLEKDDQSRIGKQKIKPYLKEFLSGIVLSIPETDSTGFYVRGQIFHLSNQLKQLDADLGFLNYKLIINRLIADFEFHEQLKANDCFSNFTTVRAWLEDLGWKTEKYRDKKLLEKKPKAEKKPYEAPAVYSAAHQDWSADRFEQEEREREANRARIARELAEERKRKEELDQRAREYMGYGQKPRNGQPTSIASLLAGNTA